MRSSDRVGKRQVRGFSFLWVLLIVALMGVGAVAAVRIEATVVQREKERELIAIGREFRSAIGRYHESQIAGRGREYPARLEDLLKDSRVPGVRRHLRKIYVDPLTGRDEWGLVVVAGRIVGVHSLSTAQPQKQAGFEAEEASFARKDRISDWQFVYPSDLMLGPPGQRTLPPPMTAASEPRT